MNQQPMQGPKPAVAVWLWVVLGVVAIIGAAFFSWYFLMGPGKKTTATTTPTTTTTTDKTAGWSTFKSDTYSYSIKYPTDWEYKTESTTTTFAPKTAATTPILTINVKTDKLETVISQQKELFAKDSTFKEQGTATVGGAEATTLTFINNADKTIMPVVDLVSKNNNTYIISGEGSSKTYNSTVKSMISTFKFTTATTTTTTSTDLTYTNSTYGFTLTFPAAWKGYKFKEANLSGITMTYYVEIPTTDKNATGDSTADKGYYSPFAISVYTLDQWATVEASEGPKDTLITKNTKYAFGWSQANGVPPTDFTTAMSNEIKTIIASFKLK